MGLIGMSVVGSGTLWYLLDAPSSLPASSLNQLKTISVPFKSGAGQQPPMSSTSTPATQPALPTRTHTSRFSPTTSMGATPTAAPSSVPVTPTPPGSPTPVPPLSVTITNIPSQVMSGDTVSVVITTSQPGVSVTLYVTYSGLTQPYNSSPQTTDIGGQTTFFWSIPNFKKHTMTSANVEATASNTQGQSAQSSPVQVQVMPASG